MDLALVSLITSPDDATRNRSLDGICAAMPFADLLAECDALDAFRDRSENLYERAGLEFVQREASHKFQSLLRSMYSGSVGQWMLCLRNRYEPDNSTPANGFEADGWYVLGAYFIVPKYLQAVVRFENFDPDKGLSGNTSDVWTFGMNYYIKGDDLKLMA